MVFESEVTLQMNSYIHDTVPGKWMIYGIIKRVSLLLFQADIFIF